MCLRHASNYKENKDSANTMHVQKYTLHKCIIILNALVPTLSLSFSCVSVHISVHGYLRTYCKGTLHSTLYNTGQYIEVHFCVLRQ